MGKIVAELDLSLNTLGRWFESGRAHWNGIPNGLIIGMPAGTLIMMQSLGPGLAYRVVFLYN